MRTFNLLTGVSFAVLTSVAALGSAGAATFNWDWTTTPDTSGTTQSPGNGLTMSNGGQTLTAEAFQVTGNGTATSGAKITAGLATSRLFNYSGTGFGLGVTDNVESGQPTNTGPLGDAGSPAHTVSNQAQTTGGAQVTDMVAFKLPTITGNTVSVTNVVLNQFGNNVSPAGHSNVSILIGGTATTNSASLAGLSITQLEAAGFHLLQFDGTGVNRPAAAAPSPRPRPTSNDAAGDERSRRLHRLHHDRCSLAQRSDHHSRDVQDRVDRGDVRTHEGAGQPGTLAVFGIGLAGLAALRRRRKNRT